MKKPKAKTLRVLDFHECTDYINKKYGIDTRDFARSHQAFSEWCKSKGEPKTQCPPGADQETIKKHQEQYARFKSDIAAGLFVDPPYQDFWHWLIDHADITRGGTFEFYEGIGDGAEDWQKHILGLYLKEFGKGPYLTDW